jgi:N-acetylglucosaminyldiphosphoundecaprenol N-acetyl-beta-D-mannosaminyltransferase
LVTISSYRNFIDEVFTLAKTRRGSYVCFANVHMVMEAFRNPAFQRIVNEADLVAADGKPISVFLRMAEGIKQERICGMDIFHDLLQTAARSSSSIYLYGTTPDLLAKITEKAQKQFPDLKIAGAFSPPFRQLSAEEKQQVIEMINNANPDLLFVSLGCPKQEMWMAENKGKIKACLLGLGQAFRVYGGEEKRLPRWMRELALEWAYRLWLEPCRLWRRYLVTNSMFVLLASRALMRIWFNSAFSFSGRHSNLRTKDH